MLTFKMLLEKLKIEKDKVFLEEYCKDHNIQQERYLYDLPLREILLLKKSLANSLDTDFINLFNNAILKNISLSGTYKEKLLDTLSSMNPEEKKELATLRGVGENEGDTILHAAVKLYMDVNLDKTDRFINLKLIRLMIEEFNVNPMQRNGKGEFPLLCFFCEQPLGGKEWREIVTYLLDRMRSTLPLSQEFPIDITDNNGHTLLFMLCDQMEDLFKSLNDSGMNSSIKQANIQNMTEVLGLLIIKFGANIHAEGTRFSHYNVAAETLKTTPLKLIMSINRTDAKVAFNSVFDSLKNLESKKSSDRVSFLEKELKETQAKLDEAMNMIQKLFKEVQQLKDQQAARASSEVGLMSNRQQTPAPSSSQSSSLSPRKSGKD